MDGNNRIANLTAAICGVILSLGLSGPAMGQQSGTNNRPTATDRAIEVTDINLRDAQIRSLELGKERASDKPLPRPAPQTVQQVQQDFSRIKEINAQIMKSYAAGEAPDYKNLSEAMAEMNKCASRLKTNLVLPEQAAYESREKSDRSPLLDLNEVVTRFVTNPIFKNANTIDAEQAANAKRDLLGIIDLSHRIRKSAEKLSKQGNK